MRPETFESLSKRPRGFRIPAPTGQRSFGPIPGAGGRMPRRGALLYRQTALMTSEGGCLRVRFETLGVRILFVGLVLGLVAGIVWFPVWS